MDSNGRLQITIGRQITNKSSGGTVTKVQDTVRRNKSSNFTFFGFGY
jgi:hypothetical protein